MSNELLTILEYIEQERGIRRDVLVKAIETALLSASKKSINPASELSVRLDPDTGDIQAWAKLEVVASNPNHDQLLFDQAKAKEKYKAKTIIIGGGVACNKHLQKEMKGAVGHAKGRASKNVKLFLAT